MLGQRLHARTAKMDWRHACCMGRSFTNFAILNHDTRFWQCSHCVGGMQENFRRWLS